MRLDDMLESAAGGATEIAAGWGQGRATFGGLVAGLLVARAEELCAASVRLLRAATTVFVSPVAPGPAALDGRILRAGSAATQVQVSIVQDGEPRAVLLASFGEPRASDIEVDAAARDPRPELPSADTLEPVPYVPGLTPDFFAHVDVRYANGALPFSGASDPEFGGWMRFRERPATFGIRELITLADAWPPAIAPMLDHPASMSTLAWTFEPVASPESARDEAAAFWQYAVRALAARDGYAHTTARIWDDRGRLRALSRQTETFFG